MTLLVLPACASYVNVPGQGGDLARHDPNLKTVGAVETEALRAVLSSRPIREPFRVILPKGTRPAQYVAVTNQLGDRAT